MQILPLVERVARRALNASGLESRWVNTKIANLHLYEARGRGSLPPVIILHGISSAATPFAAVIRRLLPHVRGVLAPEAPGHGFSGQPSMPLTPEILFEAMAELLDREIREPILLFGNSLGGGLALNYALTRPERVRGLFLSSPAGATMAPADLSDFLGTFHLRSKEEAMAFLNRLYHKKPWFSPLIAADIQQLFARDVIRSFTSAVRPEHLFTAEQLRALRMPIYLCWGRSERLMPPQNLEFFKKHLPPEAIIEEPEGFGHCPHLDAPGLLAEKIVEFLRTAVEATSAQRLADRARER